MSGPAIDSSRSVRPHSPAERDSERFPKTSREVRQLLAELYHVSSAHLISRDGGVVSWYEGDVPSTLGAAQELARGIFDAPQVPRSVYVQLQSGDGYAIVLQDSLVLAVFGAQEWNHALVSRAIVAASSRVVGALVADGGDLRAGTADDAMPASSAPTARLRPGDEGPGRQRDRRTLAAIHRAGAVEHKRSSREH